MKGPRKGGVFLILGYRIGSPRTLSAAAAAALDSLRASHPEFVHDVMGDVRIGIYLPGVDERPSARELDQAETRLDKLLPADLAADPALGRFSSCMIETDHWSPLPVRLELVASDEAA